MPAPLKGFEWSVVAQVDRPTMIGAPAGDTRVFVTEQGGVVQVVLPDGTVSTFLDLTDRVRQESNEQGLLGLAFHPEFSENGRSSSTTRRTPPVAGEYQSSRSRQALRTLRTLIPRKFFSNSNSLESSYTTTEACSNLVPMVTFGSRPETQARVQRGFNQRI